MSTTLPAYFVLIRNSSGVGVMLSTPIPSADVSVRMGAMVWVVAIAGGRAITAPERVAHLPRSVARERNGGGGHPPGRTK
jgi:hypothetical protein